MVDLHLTSDDQRRLAHGLESLLSPFDHETLDGWRAEVCRTLRELLGADMAGFQFPVPEAREIIYSEQIDTEALRRYHELFEPLEREFAPTRRMLELRVVNRKLQWGDRLDDYYRTRYFNDYIRPLRCFDALTSAVPLQAGTPDPRMSATEPDRGMAILYFHHDHPDRRPFGKRGLALLRLVHSAFEGGVHLQMKSRRQRRSILEVLDRMDASAVISDRDGRIVHESGAVRDLEGDDPDAGAVREALRAMARSLGSNGAVGHLDREGEPARGEAPPRRVDTRRGVYRIRSGLLDDPTRSGRRIAMAWTTRPDRDLLSPEEMEERYGLTPRESDVALLLAHRMSQSEIADRLFISPHTVRHHTENVFLKLGVHSRADAARVVRGDPGG